MNSNPATIMTDSSIADATYVEPLTVEMLEKVLKKERPCALLPTLGGQTGLNLAMEASKAGVLDRYNVELIGANEEIIDKAEDREKFKQAMEKIGCSQRTWPPGEKAEADGSRQERARELGKETVPGLGKNKPSRVRR